MARTRRNIDRRIGSSIRGIAIDDDTDWLSEEEVDATYERFGIHRYENFSDFVRNYFHVTSDRDVSSEHVNESFVTRFLRAWGYDKDDLDEAEMDVQKMSRTKGISASKAAVEYVKTHSDKANELWEDYSHRDTLIATGQYEKARNRQYVENLLKKYHNALHYSDDSGNLDQGTMLKVLQLLNATRDMTDKQVLAFIDAGREYGVDSARASRLPYIIDSDPKSLMEGDDELDLLLQIAKSAGLISDDEERGIIETGDNDEWDRIHSNKKPFRDYRKRIYRSNSYEKAFSLYAERVLGRRIGTDILTYSDSALIRWGDRMPRTRDGRLAFMPKVLNDRYFELKRRR